MAISNTSEGVARLKKIEEKKDSLIERVENFFNARGEDPKVVVPVQPTQLQNLLRLALATSSVKEIQLFIRYQCARHKDWNKNDLGKNLESQIEEVGNEAGNDTSLKLDLVRLFLGYFVREARFRNPD